MRHPYCGTTLRGTYDAGVATQERDEVLDALDALVATIRDNATAEIALGADGFNVPSLLSINYSAPYLHRGQAQTLEEVFPLHGLGPQGAIFPPVTTIANTLTADQQKDLLVFLKTIDGTTVPFRSEGDDFRDSLRLAGPCP